jgi:uncharacterized DUF497 family protein
LELQLQFEWDETKNRSNVHKHGFHFADAEEMFRGLLLVKPDTSEDREERWVGIGMIQGQDCRRSFRRTDGKHNTHYLFAEGKS